MAPRIVVLTGSGISAESGIPTFRDANGLWKNHRIEEVASPRAFANNPALVHEFYDMRRRLSLDVKPNAAHDALGALERALGDGMLIVTQNVDELHECAGSKAVIHMHGELASALCTACGAHHRWTADLGDEPPCPACGRQALRPDIVWFGENVYRLNEINAAVDNCETFVVIGTSGAVHPAAGLAERARAQGAWTVLLNLEDHGGSAAYDEVLIGPASSIVPEWVAETLAQFKEISVKGGWALDDNPYVDKPGERAMMELQLVDWTKEVNELKEWIEGSAGAPQGEWQFVSSEVKAGLETLWHPDDPKLTEVLVAATQRLARSPRGPADSRGLPWYQESEAHYLLAGLLVRALIAQNRPAKAQRAFDAASAGNDGSATETLGQILFLNWGRLALAHDKPGEAFLHFWRTTKYAISSRADPEFALEALCELAMMDTSGLGEVPGSAEWAPLALLLAERATVWRPGRWFDPYDKRLREIVAGTDVTA